MNTLGILMLCYVSINGQSSWVEGREVKELKPQNHAERSLFVPTSGAQAFVVETNNCRYLEDPVQGYERMLASREIDTIKIGNKDWCLIDEWGKQQCAFDTLEQCLRRMEKLSYCEPNKEKTSE